MKFKDYVEACKLLLKENPELADVDVVYASDDEGNSYCKGVYGPGIVLTPNDPENYYLDAVIDEDFFEEYCIDVGSDGSELRKIVCIN